MKFRRPLLLILLFALQCAFFIPIALHRFVAGDEGYYLMAAKLVTQGKQVYIDFFYPQMPLLPYVYGLWFKILGVSWVNARVLAALFAALTGTLLYNSIARRFNARFAAAALILFCFASFVFSWYTVAKTHALAVLLAFLSYDLFLRAKEARKASLYFWSGLLLGLTIEVRLTFFPIIFVYCWWILRDNALTPAERKQFSARGFLGLLVAALPAFICMALAWDSFWFGNIGYHLIRSNDGAARAAAQKWGVASKAFGINLSHSQKFSGYQLGFLAIFALCTFIERRITKKEIDPAFGIALVLGIVCVLPTPVYLDYFCVLVPFLIVTFCYFVRDSWQLPFNCGPRVRLASRSLLTAVLCIFLADYGVSFVSDLKRYTITGEGLKAIHSARPDDRRIATMSEISRTLDSAVPADAVTLVFWPAYALESHTLPFPGLENDFGFTIGKKLDRKRAAHLHVATTNDIRTALNKRRVDALIIAPHDPESLQDLLPPTGYEKAAETNGIVMMRRSGMAP